MAKIVNNIETVESIIRQVFQNLDSKNYEKARQLINEANRIAKENIYFAIIIKILVLLLSALGVATMWMAVFADVGVSIIAILNSMRVLYGKE